MNLALWLERAGKSHPDHPAVGLGTRTLRSYGELAGRVARLAGALTDRYGLRPGDRVAIAAKNSPDYLDLLYAVWHAGLAAVPANAKLHGAELGYILEHSGARACFASAGLDAAIAPHAPQSLERLDHHRQRRIRGTVRGRGGRAGRRATATISPGCSTPRAPPAGRRARCSRTACWRSRATPTCSRRRSGRARRRHPARGADEPWVRPLHHGARGAARRQRRAGIRRVRAGGGLRPDRRVAARLDVRGAHHDQAPGRMPGRLPCRNIRTSCGAARRCTSRTRSRRSTASARGSRRSTARARAR